jgi:bla regulator protein blaR1
MSFFYAFTLTMLHSLWQLPVLALLYMVIEKTNQQAFAIQKRNLGLFILLGQLLLSLYTFTVLQSNTSLSFNSQFVVYSNWLIQYQVHIFGVYAAFLLFTIIKKIIGFGSFKHVAYAQLAKPNVNIRLYTQSMVQQLGIQKNVQIWLSKNIATPITFGFLKPIILLPFSLSSSLSMQELESLILHELTHIKNNDYIFNWFVLVMESIFFFNPFVYIITKKIKQYRELACDAQVVSLNYEAITYASTLLQVAKMQQSKLIFANAAIGSKNGLLSRIQFFCKYNPAQEKPIKKQWLALVPFVIAAICFALPNTNNTLKAKKTNVFNISKELARYYPIKINESQPSKENLLIAEAEFVTTNLDIIQQQPHQDKKPFNNIIEEQPEEFVEEVIPETLENYAQTVSLAENANKIDSIKKVTIEYETSHGKFTRVYSMVFKNGQWIKIPKYASRDVATDSTLQNLPTIELVQDSIQ